MLLPLDLETTGLNPEEDRILEVAWTVVADDLSERLVGIHSRVVTPGLHAWNIIEGDMFIQDMHGTSGLLDDLIRPGTLMLSDVEDQILQDIYAGVPDDEPLYLLGSGAHFDLAFIRNWMPRLAKRLSHRIYDTRTLVMFFESLGIEHSVVNDNKHRAADDVAEVLEIAREYRSTVQEFQRRVMSEAL